MNISIKHSGIVVGIEHDTVKVRITRASACGTCQIAQACTVAEKQEMIVEVKAPTKALALGDEVVVTISRLASRDAVLLGFGIPLTLLILILIAAKWYGANDGVAALTALCSLTPYYIIIGINRKRIAERLQFAIE